MVSEIDPNIKVLFAFYVSDKKANGALTSLSLLLNHLTSRVDLYFCSNKALPRHYGVREEKASITIKRAGKGKLGALLTILNNNILTFRFIKKHNIQVIHVNDSGMIWNVVLASKIMGVKLLLNLRDTLFEDGGAVSPSKKHRLMGKLADSIVTLSAEMSQHWQKRMALDTDNNGKFSHVYSAKQTHIFNNHLSSKLVSKYNIPKDKFLVLVPAAFTSKKQQHKLLESFSELDEHKKRSMLILFAGDFVPETNAYADKCFNLTRALDLEEHVKFLGFQDQIGIWFSISDVSILASTNEGLARGTIDSMSIGTPVVCFDFCSASETVGKYQAGRVVPINDFNALWDNVWDYFSSSTLQSDHGKNGLFAANNLFDPNKNADAYFLTYQRLISR